MIRLPWIEANVATGLDRAGEYDGAAYKRSPSEQESGVRPMGEKVRIVGWEGLRQDVVMPSHVMGSDLDVGLDSDSIPDVLGRTATIRTGGKAYANAGVGRDDVELAELHDCLTNNDMMACTATGFGNAESVAILQQQ
jgi:hypothetical protein